jgi:hypothetical protein
MNAKLFLLLFIAIFSWIPLANSQEAFDDIIEQIIPKTNLSNEQLLHLREELKVQKMFIEGVKEIEIGGGEFKNLEKSTNTIDDLLRNSIGAKTTTLNSEVQDVVKGAINRKGIQNTLIKAKDMAYGFANNKKIMMTSIARRFGFDVGLVYVLTLQVDVTFPMIMIASGQPQFGALLATPVSSMTTGTYAAVKSAVKFRQIVKMLGGTAKTIEHFKIFRHVKKFFGQHILLKHDLLDFKFAGKTFVMTVERQNLMSRVLGKMGINKQLNYQSLMNLLEENKFMPEVLERLRRSDRPNEVKFLRLLNKIQSAGDEQVMEAIHKKFSKFVHEVSDIPDFSRQRDWAVKLAHSKDFDQFITRLAQMPDDIPPKVFDRMWRNYILQNASKTIGPYFDKATLKAFNRMYDSYDKVLRKDLMTSVDTQMGAHMKSKFVDYIYDSLQGVGVCGHLFKPRRGGVFTPPLI